MSPGEPPAWWGLGRLIRWIGLVVLIVGAVGLFDALRADRPLVVWAAILIGGLAALGVPRMLASRSGSRWARQGLAEVRSTTASTVARELDRRIGRPLRDSLRLRAGVGSAYLEVSLLLRDLRRG